MEKRECMIILTMIFSAFITTCTGFYLFGTILGCSRGPLGLALGGPGSSVELPGLLLGALGALCDPVRLPGDVLGAPWRLLRRHWARLRSPKRLQGAALEVSLEAKMEHSCRRELNFHVFS